MTTSSSNSSRDTKLRARCSSSWRAAAQHWLAGSSLGQELSGSLGDLGTFLPLVVALSATIQLDLGTTLLFSGLYNVLSGVGFQIPMCVQPMKTIAAVALAAPGLTLPEVMAAGLFVGCVMLLLGITGAMDLASRAVPGSIVRGIQLAVGLQLAQKGITQVFKVDQHSYRQLWGVEGCVLGVCAAAALLITTLPAALADSTQQQQQQQQQRCQQGLSCDSLQQEQDHEPGHQQEQPHAAGRSKHQDGFPHHRWAPADHQHQHQHQQQQPGVDAECPQDQTQHHVQHQQHHMEASHRLVLSDPPAQALPADAGACGGCSSSTSSTSVPSALLLVLLGLLLTVLASPDVLTQLRLGPSIPKLYMPTWESLKAGVLKAGLAQLPLTSLNSVIAVSHLAAQLFPDRVEAQGWRWRPGAVAVSVAAMNLVGCWFGAFPCCHGSGGLAAQYKFGARTGLAPVLLGGMKVSLALLFGSSLLQLLKHFPQPLLGALLLLSGVELAASARKETEQRGYTLMLLTAAAILGLKNTAVGFAVGLGGCGIVAVWAAVAAGWQRWQQSRRGSYQLVPTTSSGVQDHRSGSPV